MKTQPSQVLAAALFSLLLTLGPSLAQKVRPKFRHEYEWGKWKQTHDRNYSSAMDELERHLVWLSNKVYIDQHNANAHIFGYTLSMNHLGDLVRQKSSISAIAFY